MELNQKLANRHSIQGVYIREKYLCKNLGVKEGGGCLFEGCVFSRTYGNITCYLVQCHCKRVCNILICCLGNRLYYALGILQASNNTQSNYIMITSEEVLHLCT